MAWMNGDDDRKVCLKSKRNVMYTLYIFISNDSSGLRSLQFHSVLDIFLLVVVSTHAIA